MNGAQLNALVRRTGGRTLPGRWRGLALLVIMLGVALALQTRPWSTPVAAAPAQQAPGLPTATYLPLSLAQKAASAAIDACAAQGYRVAVTLVDRDGVVILINRADGATGATVDVSRGKAYASAGFQAPTAALQEASQSNPGLISVPGFVILPGGLPIKSGDIVVAGIGVSGTPSGAIDEGCATAGIQAIAGSL